MLSVPTEPSEKKPLRLQSMSALFCPECGSQKLFKAGKRYLKNGEVNQRLLCRKCARRFSEKNLRKPSQNLSKQSLNTHSHIVSNRQICAILEEAKNLTTTTETKTVAGDESYTQESKGRFVRFLMALINNGANEASAKLYVAYLRRIEKKGGNLLDPDSVKAAIAGAKNWSTATKALAANSYSAYLKEVGGTWKPPKYQVERKLPYIPTEKELDCLISAAHSKLSAYLLLLKETGMRASEAWNLKWNDVDFGRNAITLNETLKHGTPRMFRISPRLTSVLNTLPKTSTIHIFQKEAQNPFSLLYFQATFKRLRRANAQKMRTPNLAKITFHTFRHWFATMEYHKTNSLLHVQERLGHKSVLTTTIYTHLVNFDADSYYSATAETVEEAKALVETGFQYVCDIEGFKLFRKPK